MAMKDPPPRVPPTPFTVFLDRDGVLNVAPKLVVRGPAQFQWVPGAKEALARLNVPHVRIALCTNQPFTYTGLMTPRRLAMLHAWMLEELRQAGGRLDRIEAGKIPFLRRHKPRPGMLHDAAKAFDTDPARAVMVGDNIKDAEAARRYGCDAILVATSHTAVELEKGLGERGLRATIVLDLGAAVDLILQRAAS